MKASEDPGLYFIVRDGGATVTDVRAYEMASIWEHAADQPAKVHETATE
jgi:hypothetical protein